MSTFHLLILVFMFIIILLVIPVGVTFIMQRKYGPTMPGKVAAVFILGVIAYYTLFFTQAHLLIPDSWRPETKQVYQCEWKTVYVEKQP